MKQPEPTLTLGFSTRDGQTYRLDLRGSAVGEARGQFTPPYDPATWQAVMLALEPGFVVEEADQATRAALQPLGDLAWLPETVGAALARALLADEAIRLGFGSALSMAEKRRQPLPVEMRFGPGCDVLEAAAKRYLAELQAGETAEGKTQP